MRILHILYLCTTGTIIAAVLSGCATLISQREEINFINPQEIIHPKIVQPNTKEQQGVLLRVQMSDTPLIYSSTTQIYSQIDATTAIPLNADKTVKQIFEKGKESGTFFITTETGTEKDSEYGSEKFLINTKGEIIRFVNGSFNSSSGKVTLLSHTRTRLFPDKPVKIDDTWQYDETINTQLDSLLLSENSESPDTIKVKCHLTGFAEVNGYRCAVISTRTISHKKTLYKTLFKNIKLKINLYASEIIYYDYKRGITIARITRARSFSSNEDASFCDESQFQSIYIIQKKRK